MTQKVRSFCLIESYIKLEEIKIVARHQKVFITDKYKTIWIHKIINHDKIYH